MLSELEDVPATLLEEVFSQGTTRVRQNIASVLGRRGKKAPEKLLLRMMDEGDESIRFNVAWELARAGTNIPTEFLLEALQHSSPRIRETATDTLEDMEEDIPINLLLIALHDQDRDIRHTAMRALDNPEVQVPLEALLAYLHTETENDSILHLIVRLLGGRGLEEQVPLEPLLKLFDREYVELRASVIRILGRFGGHAHVEELLIASLGDSEEVVRDAATAALKQAYPEALRTLASAAISSLQGQKPGAPFDSIAQAFFAGTVMNMEYASPAIFERLTQLLDWPYWQVRLKAILAFGKLRRNIPDKAIRCLYELRHDPGSRAVREAADKVLAEILSLETGIEDD